MAIEKNNVKAVSRFDSEFSVGSRSRESMSTDDDEFQRRNSMDSEDDDEFDDADSGAGSDDFDLLELGETGSEFCQVGDQTCCIPFELYDLPDLHGILSLDVWNDCLTEEERFGLTKYLPDMDQDTFMLTLKELFEGGNFHFGTPITKLYQMLKGGQCEPRVALYRQGLNFFQTHQHYHLLRRHQDSLVSSFLQMQEAWQNCKGYSIEEKLRVLNIVRSQKSLMGERNEDTESGSSERESDEALLSMRLKGWSDGKKAGHDHLYGASPTFDVFSGGKAVPVGVTKFAQQNPKGLLKVGGSKNSLPNVVSSSVHSRSYGNQGTKSCVRGSDFVASCRSKANVDEDQEMMYGMPSKGHWNVMDGNVMSRGRAVQSGKKLEIFGDDECDFDGYLRPHQSSKAELPAHGRNSNINQLSDIKVLTAKPSSVRGLHDSTRRSKYVDPAYVDQMRPTKGRASQIASYSTVEEPYWIKNTLGETYLTDPGFDYQDRVGETRKLKLGSEYPDHRLKSLQASEQIEGRNFHPAKRAKHVHENMRVPMRNGGSNMFHEGEETESDSDQIEDEEDISPLIVSKRATHGRLENSRSSMSRSVFAEKQMKRAKKGVNESTLNLDRVLPDSSTMANFGKYVPRSEIETYSSKIRQKAKANNMESVQNPQTRVPYDRYYDSLRNPYIEGDIRSTYRLRGNGQVPAEFAGSSPMSLNKASPVEKSEKGNVGNDFSLLPFKNIRDYNMEEDGGPFESNPMGRNDSTIDGGTSSVKKKKKKKRKEVQSEIDRLDGSDYLPSHQHISELIPLKDWAKKRPELECGSPGVSTSELPVLEVGMADAEREVKPQKKTLPPIMPTVHTDFSFSIIHLLSAVRIALTSPGPDDPLGIGKGIESTAVELEDHNANHGSVNGTLEGFGMNNRAPEKSNVPTLTVQEIVDRVRSDPGDPCILRTAEPLLDLVRGVLKIFSSKTAPLGAKGWKPLICYEKSTKRWSWVGPAQQSSTDHEPPEEVISPDAWKISRKMLVKLVDSYANWLKSGQETLLQIGSMSPPPSELKQINFDEKERFRDLRAQKSLTTITQSSDKVRDYFRKEEQLRYSVPDRAFSYTAADGKKSIVAPLRRCGGKPTSKARDHFMLKRNRPPHVTILCLVRDAASRLPGSIGTRADVCTLIRDSQYVVEEVTDFQVNQVVSGALDRLHYERDPCVQFDSERKLWVYLHRDRDEEDFEDDGTSSTKKWKRQKKDISEQDDQVTVACHGNTESNGFDLSSDLNVAPICPNSEKSSDVVYDDDARQRTEDESELLCQEDSMNEGLGGET